MASAAAPTNTQKPKTNPNGVGALVAAASASTGRKSNPRKPPPAPPSPTTDPDTASGVLDALRELGFSVDDVQRVVRKRPRVLRLRAADHIVPTIAYLRAAPLCLSDKQVRSAVSSAPQIFSETPPAEAFDPRVAFLTDVAHVATGQLAHAVSKRPHVLWMDLVAARAVVEAVQTCCPLIAPESLGKVISRVPQALVTTPTAIGDNLAFLSDIIRSNAALPRVLTKVPLCLVYSQKTMSLRIDALREAGASGEAIAQIVIALPDILHWSIPHKLQPALGVIADLVGEDAVPGVLEKLPAILGSVDAFDSRIAWLRDTVGLDDAEVRTVLRQAPAVLTYSVPANLAPKWLFVQNTMGGSKADVVEAPREILCANLQQRAMPRYAFAMSVAAERVEGMSVPQILRGSDIDFCRNVVLCDPAEYRTFVEEDRFLFFYAHWIL